MPDTARGVEHGVRIPEQLELTLLPLTTPVPLPRAYFWPSAFSSTARLSWLTR